MNTDLWYDLAKNKNINYLKKLYNDLDFVRLQMNLITLRLCIKRDNLGVPVELWNIICEYIKSNFNSFAPAYRFSYVCSSTHKRITIYSSHIPKCCLCHNIPIFPGNTLIEKPKGMTYMSTKELEKYTR